MVTHLAGQLELGKYERNRLLKGHCIEFGLVWIDSAIVSESGVNRLGDTSAFVITAGHLLLTRRGKTSMYTVGIVFEFYTVPL